jgi:hypothetical protein
MSRLSAFTTLAVALASFYLMACDALKTTNVTLEISGDPLSLFSGYYETTTEGQKQVSGAPPASYTFQARKKYDIVAVQLARAGVGEFTAKLVSDGVTRDSATTGSGIGTIHLEWIPR